MSSTDPNRSVEASKPVKLKRVYSDHGRVGKELSRRDRSPDEPQEYSLVLMGLTGSGKSAFISSLVGRDIGIGRDLKSCEWNLSQPWRD